MSYDVFNTQISSPIGDGPVAVTRHIALIGSSGTGKTTWSCRNEDCLVILTEAQAEGRVDDTNRNARVVVITKTTGNPQYDHLSDFQKVSHCIKWITRELLGPSNTGWVPQVIVVDSFTEMFRMVADEVSGNGEKAWTYETWKKYGDLCLRLVRKFRDMGPTLIGTFLDESADGGEGQVPIRRMSVGMKSMSNRIAGLFDMVFWTECQERTNGETAYAIRTCGGFYNGQKLEQGKSHPALSKWIDPSVITPPEILRIIAEWREEGRKDVTKVASIKSSKKKAKAGKE